VYGALAIARAATHSMPCFKHAWKGRQATDPVFSLKLGLHRTKQLSASGHFVLHRTCAIYPEIIRAFY